MELQAHSRESEHSEFIEQLERQYQALANNGQPLPKWQALAATLSSDVLASAELLDNTPGTETPLLLLVQSETALPSFHARFELRWNDIDVLYQQLKPWHRGPAGAENSSGTNLWLVDGGEDIPKSTVRLNASDFFEMCARDGLSPLDIPTYLALQKRGLPDGRLYDLHSASWLDAHDKENGKVIFGYATNSAHAVSLRKVPAAFFERYLGGRRGIKLPIPVV